MKQMNQEEIVSKLVSVFENQEKLLAAYLFGSCAAGEPTPDSDVDIGVLYNERVPLDRLVKLQLFVDDTTGLQTDIVDLREASPFLALDIVNGIRFLCTDSYRCDEFELFVLARAGDLAPFERQRRAALLHMGDS